MCNYIPRRGLVARPGISFAARRRPGRVFPRIRRCRRRRNSGRRPTDRRRGRNRIRSRGRGRNRRRRILNRSRRRRKTPSSPFTGALYNAP